jgi:hypothetical protein
MVDNQLFDFLHDNEKYNLFSYDDYKKSSIDLKLLKISLLNEYYKLKLSKCDVNKLRLFVDFDGVILNTMELSRELLLKLHGIDYYKHSRDNVENDKIVGNFFATIDWNFLLDYSHEINRGSEFLKLFRDSIIYKPTIFSAVSSEREEKIKENKFLINYPGIDNRFVESKKIKTCDDEDAVLVDDSDFYLINWNGKPVHFDSGGRASIFFDIHDLGELYYLFPFNEKTQMVENISGLYDDYIQKYDVKSKRLKWYKK